MTDDVTTIIKSSVLPAIELLVQSLAALSVADGKAKAKSKC